MDISKDNFWPNMANIVFLAGRSDYIAFDLEMTGISTRKPQQGRPESLEEVYEEARLAASTFQAVQLGLTFVCFVDSVAVDDAQREEQTGEYKTFTVSIPISPMFATDDPILAKMAEVTDRQISFSYGSLLHFERHGFDFKSALGEGVPYLSREELAHIEREMLQDKEYEHNDPASVGDWAVKFYDDLREEVKAWIHISASTGAPGHKYRVLDPQGTGTLRKSTVRLVRQLVREEFPTMRCARDRTDLAMTIRAISEDDIKEKTLMKDKTRKKFREQIGVAWLVEVLLGSEGKADALFTDDFSISPSEPDDDLIEALGIRHKESFQALVRRAQRNKPVLVGHNILHDLCFLHTMFVGQLPRTMEGFKNSIHRLFPRVLDTKVMTAAMTDADAVDETLEDLFNLFKLQDCPHTRTMLGWGHNVRNRSFQSNQQVAHEAGFDSFMTAIVFLKAAFRQLELQAENFKIPSKHINTAENCRRPESWLQDHAREDPGLFTRTSQVSARLPIFHSSFFKPVANKLRMSVLGLLDLAATPGSEPEAIPRVDSAEWALNDPLDSSDDIIARLRNEMNKLRLQLEERLRCGEEAKTLNELSQRIGYLHGNIECRTARNSRHEQ